VFMHYLEFLAQGRNVLRSAKEDMIESVLSCVRQLYLTESLEVPDSARANFRSVRLFTAVRWSTNTAGVST
jgi:hypothetical protein